MPKMLCAYAKIARISPTTNVVAAGILAKVQYTRRYVSNSLFVILKRIILDSRLA